MECMRLPSSLGEIDLSFRSVCVLTPAPWVASISRAWGFNLSCLESLVRTMILLQLRLPIPPTSMLFLCVIQFIFCFIPGVLLEWSRSTNDWNVWCNFLTWLSGVLGRLLPMFESQNRSSVFLRLATLFYWPLPSPLTTHSFVSLKMIGE